MKAVQFHPEAETELAAEALYYEDRSPGLGKRFIGEIETAVALALEFPDMGAPYRHGTRRVFPKKFPFSIVYQAHSSGLVILAIAPFPRKPAYWRHRKSDR